MNTCKLSNQPGILALNIGLFDSPDVFQHALPELILKLCEDVGSVLAVRMTDALLKRDWDEVVKLANISPHSYTDWESYYKDSQIVGLVKKYPHWDIKTKPKLEAMKTFIACERTCQRTNDRIWSRKDSLSFLADNAIIYIAQKKISEILGDTPCLEDLTFEFGPGSAYGVKYNTSALHKLGSTLDVSDNCYELARSYLVTCPGWRPNSDFLLEGPLQPPVLNTVVGDRLSFVPKTATTDRPIAIGPLINVLLQKGIGSCLRRRLKPYNDLNKLQDHHKRQALRGSIDGTLCTIDLKNASDTIAYAVVQELLPPAWFELLDKARTQSYEIEGISYPYSKFSAMGNGFTFELESLIFYAVAYACCVHIGENVSDVSVFGDDIIAPVAAFSTIVDVLTNIGFTVNSDKSFCYGPFRESCGGDFFNGIDVRPFYLKSRLTFRTLFLFHNYLVRKGWQFIFPGTYRYVRKLIGKHNISYFKTWNSLDDGALLDNSMPVSSYNSVKSSYKGLKNNALKRTFGVSAVLYRLQLSDKQSSTDLDFRNHFTRITRIKFRYYRYVHI